MSIYSPPGAGPARQIYAQKRLSALEKSAVIVAHLHPDQAATVLRGLRADDLRRFSAALQAVRGLGDSAVKGVIREFLAALNAAPTIDDGTEAARSLLGGLLDAPIVDRLLSEVGMSKLNLWAMMAMCLAALRRIRRAMFLRPCQNRWPNNRFWRWTRQNCCRMKQPG